MICRLHSGYSNIVAQLELVKLHQIRVWDQQKEPPETPLFFDHRYTTPPPTVYSTTSILNNKRIP
ncbi:hypothetical protein Hanom_Chr02g00154401 [Helianthus anomalus]